MQNELLVIVNESGLEETQGKTILDQFTQFFKEANEWKTKAELLVVTDISQVKEMQDAREARLALKNIRVGAENVRKQLKEKSIREGKAIDGVANVIKALIVPIEEHLEKQEKFIENLEKERKEKVNAQRELELSKFVADVSMYNYKEMSDEVFTNLIGSVKKIWDAEQEKIKKAEQERIEKERLDAEEREKQRLENIKLKQEAEARDLELKKERELREKELAKEREEQNKKLEAEKLKAKQEAEARKKLEAELKSKKDEEKKLKKEKELKEAKEKADKLEVEKQARLAPDKDKLLTYAKELENISVPELQTQEAKDSLSKALDYLGQAIKTLKIK